jgi:hypothetical protein
MLSSRMLIRSRRIACSHAARLSWRVGGGAPDRVGCPETDRPWGRAEPSDRGCRAPITRASCGRCRRSYEHWSGTVSLASDWLFRTSRPRLGRLDNPPSSAAAQTTAPTPMTVVARATIHGNTVAFWTGTAQGLLRSGQRDANHGCVENHHHLRDADNRKDQPTARIGWVSRQYRASRSLASRRPAGVRSARVRGPRSARWPRTPPPGL